MTAQKLRQWREVKPVAGPCGAAITTRLRTTPEDEHVLDLVAKHLGKLRRADLAAVTRPEPLDGAMDAAAKRQERRNRLNTRKKALRAESSARWANAIIAGNDAQYRLARDGQHRHIIGLWAAITTIEKRLLQPTGDSLTPEARTARNKAKLPKGYPTQADRFQKQRRLQRLRAELGRVTTDWDNKRVRVTEDGKRLGKTRHNLDSAKMTHSEWRQRWNCARYRIEANGSGDEPFGNLTVTVTPDGEVSLRLPKPLEHLANANHGRYVLSGRAEFAYRADEWRTRIAGGKSVSYAIIRTPGRAGRYLTRRLGIPANHFRDHQRAEPGCRCSGVRAGGRCGPQRRTPRATTSRLARQPGRSTGAHRPRPIRVIGTSGCPRPACDHPPHPLHGAAQHHHHCGGRPRLRRRPHHRPGNYGSRIAWQTLPQDGGWYPDGGVPQPAVRANHRHGIGLCAVNPAYTSVWGDQHWRKPYENVTRHEAAATVIGRRAQGFTARRREGVTRTRPEDRVVRATDQATPDDRQASTRNRHRPGTRGTKSRPPRRTRTRQLGRATVTPAPATNGQQHQ